MSKATRSVKASRPVRTGASSGIDLVREVEELSAELSAQVTAPGILGALASRLVHRHGINTTGVWLFQGSDQELDLVAAAGQTGWPPALSKIPVAGTLIGRAVRHRQPQTLCAEDAGQDGLGKWAREHKLAYLAAYPLLSDSRVLGAFVVARSEALDEAEQAMLLLDARLVSLALRDAELIASTQRTLEKLRILVEASKALASTLDLAELLGRILDVAKTHADAERGTIFLVDDQTKEIWSLIAHGLEKQEIRLPIGKGIAGHVAQTGDIINIPDAYADPRFNPEVDKRTGFRTRNILCLPIRNKAGKIIAVLQLLNKIGGAFTNEDADFLLTLSAHMALALENAQLHQQILDKERMEKELALARGIQRSLLPETTPMVEGFDIGLLNEPCYAVGGDYYDFLSLGPRTLLAVIADVEGKGVASAMVMSNLQATLRALVLHLHSLNEIAESLNRMIYHDTRAEKYLSLFMGLIDIRHKAIHYINCGHVPPVIVRPGGEVVQLTDGGLVIGLFESAAYERGQVRMAAGDILILCTDGITESMNAQSDEYGLERLTAKVREVADRKASDIVEAVSADVAQFARGGTHLDDKVMIVVKAV